MGLRITTLSDNIAPSTSSHDILAEGGLSILIESDGVNILLDTGKTFTATHNADVLGVNLNLVDRIVLSHGHFDHTGGLRQVLSRTKKGIKVLAHPDVWQAKYARRPDEPDRFIGIPFQQRELESQGAVFELTAKPVRLTDSIITTGEISMVTDFEPVDPVLFVAGESGWQNDEVKDDQAVIIKTGEGLVIVLGCAHRGMINTIYHARQLTGVQTVRLVMGGAHLVSASEERLWQTIAALQEMGVQKLGLCHCTGLPAISVLAREFGDSFSFNIAGTTLNLS